MTNQIQIPRINLLDVQGLIFTIAKLGFVAYGLTYFLELPLYVTLPGAIVVWVALAFKNTPELIETDYLDALDNASNRIATLEEEQKELLSVIELAKKKVTTLKTEVSQKTDQVTQLETQVSALQGNVSRLSNLGNTAEMRIKELESYLSNLEKNYSISRAGYVLYMLGRLRKMKQSPEVQYKIDELEKEKKSLPDIDYLFD